MKKQKRLNVMLDDESIAKAKELGGGNVSKGLRRALDVAALPLPIKTICTATAA
jgi:post-segregation antitoxin (ccd killing protein)